VSAYDLARWSDFFVAETGAAAALTGLVIVAVSINIGTVLKFPHLPGRAAESISLLAGIVILSTLAMVPDQPAQAAGAEIAAVGAVMWAMTSATQWRIFWRGYVYPRRWISIAIGQGASLPVVVAGISLMAGAGGGLYWIVPGIVFSVVGGIVNTWVLLIEILR